MKLVLEEKELIRFVVSPIEELVQGLQGSAERLVKKEEKKCKSVLVQCITDQYLEYIKDYDTAYEIFKVLSETFERKGVQSELHCRKSLLNLKFESGPLEHHFLNFDKLIRNLGSWRNGFKKRRDLSFVVDLAG